MRPLLSLLLAALFAACSNPPADLPDDTPASSLPEPDSDLPSDASARAKLRPADAAATAQLSSFKVSRTASSSVLLNWTTLSETNNYGFNIQRRLPEHDQRPWQSIARQNCRID